MSALSPAPAGIEALYREVVMDHYRHPRNRAPLAHPDASARLDNPLCGDQIRVEVSLAEGRIQEVSARARGCSIVVAAGSVMSEVACGLTSAELRAQHRLLERLVRGEVSAAELEGLDPRLRAFARIAEVPARERCATLAWEALRAALEGAAAGVTCTRG